MWGASEEDAEVDFDAGKSVSRSFFIGANWWGWNLWIEIRMSIGEISSRGSM